MIQLSKAYRDFVQRKIENVINDMVNFFFLFIK